LANFVVTGGGGFIGSNLVEALLRRGEHVVALDDFSSGRRSNLDQAEKWSAAGAGQYTLVEGDIRDEALVRRAMDGVDYVLHQAAVPSVQRSIQDPMLTNDVNVKGTLLLLEEARRAGVRRFVFASSSSLYGESETLPKVETMPPAPISPYGLQKLTGETYCLLYNRLYGLQTIAFRYFNVFGPRQDPGSDYSAVVPLFIAAGRAGGRATIYGDGLQTRDFTYVDNVVQANLLACRAPAAACGRAYNIACGERITLNELLRRVGEIMGREIPADHVDPRPGDIRHSLAGIDLAVARLGYAPNADLSTGLRRTVEAA
jgi:nucleoside-diphosphate-sugar epimerase